ncbi:MAG: tetraacyldisaccharide 4'-kinase [Nitrospira sp.]|nr:tetraacyldisaccharide 4'-kinase [Nitrospira sp.]
MMSAGIQSWFRWAGYPYELVSRVRVSCYERGWCQTRWLPRPVISVGNLTVGGTGKTPVVMYIVDRLASQGKRVAVLSRGYRRRSRAAQLLVSDGQRVLVGPEEAGDEPHLIARRCPQAVVAVGADRFALGQWVLSRLPVDCFVLDDGFQHVQLHRDVNVLLVDATDLDGLRAGLPAGRLREPLSAAARASVVLITRAQQPSDAELAWRLVQAACPALPPPVCVAFPAEEFRRIGTDERGALSAFRGRTAMLFSGIGNAASFRSLVAGVGVTVIDHLAFPDHVHYTHAMVETIRARAKAAGAAMLVTTEKDADKVAPFLTAADACWAVRLTTEIVSGQEQLETLLTLDRRSKSAGHA